MDRPRDTARSRFWQIATLAILNLPQLPVAVFAQQEVPAVLPVEDQTEASVLDPTEIVLASPDADVMRHFKAAKRMLALERFFDAAHEFDRTLELSDQDYLISSEEDHFAYRSLRGETRRLIGAMPAKGREVYEAQFGSEAKKALATAVRDGDVRAIEAVSRRYYHTREGYRATLLVARCLLDRGNPSAAVAILRPMLSEERARSQLEPNLTTLIATGYSRLGQTNEAAKLIATLRKKYPRAEFKVAGKSVVDSDWLESTAKSKTTTSQAADHWPVHRGDAARTASNAGGAPMLSASWRVGISGIPTVQRLLSERSRAYLDGDVPALPAMHPIAIGNLLLVRTLRELVAIDVNTGRRIWYTQPLVDVSFEDIIRRDGSLEAGTLNPQTAAALGNRVWDDMVFGTISTDEENVYAVEGLSLASEMMSQRISILPNGQVGRVRAGLRSYNRLAAYSLNDEGKLAWTIGGSARSASRETAGAFFLGPPLPIEGRLYVMAEIRDEIRLLVIDPDNGKVDWSQQLAIVERNIIHPQERLRRLVGASPSYHGGVLVCPTSAGAIVAVDIVDRSLLWARPYRRNDFIVASRADMLVNGTSPDDATRWIDSSATIAQDRVIVTPVSTNEIYCLRLSDGKLLWKRPRRDGLYVACVHDGTVVVAGRRHLTSIRLSDGKPAWLPKPDFTARGRVPLPENSMPSGRGFYSNGHYYLPLTSSEVAQVDLANGEIVERIASRTSRMPGNLICAANHVISQSHDSLDAFGQRDASVRWAKTQLAKNPDDASALARLGEAILAEGDYLKALGLLDRAYAQTKNTRTRQLLVDCLIGAIKADYKSVATIAQRLDGLVVDPEQQSALLRNKAEALQLNGKPFEAFATYVKFFERSSAIDTPATVQPDLSVRPDRWLAPRLRALRESVAPSVRDRMDKSVAAMWKDIRSADSIAKLRSFSTAFDSFPAADGAKFELLKRLAVSSDDTLLEREAILKRLVSSPQASVATRAKTALVELFERRTTGDKANSAEIRWPAGLVRTKVSRRAKPRRASVRDYDTSELPVFSVPLVQDEIGSPQDRFLSIDPNQQDLIIRDALGQKKLQVSLGEPSRWGGTEMAAPWSHASSRGHVLMLASGFTLYAIDTRAKSSGERVLWQRDLAVQIPGLPGQYGDTELKHIETALGRKKVLAVDNLGRPIGKPSPVSSMGIVFQQARRLICADPITGEPHWIREQVPSGCEIWADDQHVIAVPPTSSDKPVALVFRAVDGQTLKQITLPPIKHHVIALGCKLVTWAKIGRTASSEDKLSDLFEDEQPAVKRRLSILDVVKSTSRQFDFPGGSKAWPVGHEAVGVMTPSGEFSLRAIPSGRTLLEHKLSREPWLKGIRVTATANQYFLTTERPSRRPPKTVTFAPPGEGFDKLISGRIYSFARKGGDLLWTAPVEFEHFAPIDDQPSGLPVLMLGRRKVVADKSRGGHVTGASLLLLDKRTGEVTFATNSLPDDFSEFNATASADGKAMDIRIGPSEIRLSYTDEPIAPAPPRQVGDRLRVHERHGNRNLISGVFSSVGRALFGSPSEKDRAKHREELLEGN